MKKKILFVIHDLGQGGAEKVLVSLVNHMSRDLFDVSVLSLFGGGVNEKYLAPDVKHRSVYKKDYPGNSKIMKLFSPRHLYKKYIKEKYDIVVSYLEGPSARIVSGCDDGAKIVTWIHGEQPDLRSASASFRSDKEAKACYGKFEKIVCVSNTVKNNFDALFGLDDKTCVLYNTVESDKIKALSTEHIDLFGSDDNTVRLVSVGSLKQVKGFDRLIRVHKKLIDSEYKVHTYILGKGQDGEKLARYAEDMGVSDSFTFLGYDTNPYKYVSKCDIYVCSSFREGFSTAATEALIAGTPVCTVEVSGMKELLGDNNENGIVTENSEDALCDGLKRLLDDPELLDSYKAAASKRGETFSTENTVKAVEDMILGL